MRLLKGPERERPRIRGRGDVEELESHSPVAPRVLGCSSMPFTLQIRKLGLQEVKDSHEIIKPIKKKKK